MITYENLIKDARNNVPAFATKYDELIRDDYIDESSGNHIVFGYAFTPVLIDAIQSHQDVIVNNMFIYLENMSNSEDGRVVEVCEQSVLEAINDEIDDDILISLMGPKTKEVFDAIKNYMN